MGRKTTPIIDTKKLLQRFKKSGVKLRCHKQGNLYYVTDGYIAAAFLDKEPVMSLGLVDFHGNINTDHAIPILEDCLRRKDTETDVLITNLTLKHSGEDIRLLKTGEEFLGVIENQLNCFDFRTCDCILNKPAMTLKLYNQGVVLGLITLYRDDYKGILGELGLKT